MSQLETHTIKKLFLKQEMRNLMHAEKYVKIREIFPNSESIKNHMFSLYILSQKNFFPSSTPDPSLNRQSRCIGHVCIRLKAHSEADFFGLMRFVFLFHLAKFPFWADLNKSAYRSPYNVNLILFKKFTTFFISN